MSLVKGENVIVYIYDPIYEEWKMYGCARSCTLITNTEFIEVSTTGSGKYKSYKPTVNSFTGTLDGLVNLNDPNLLSIADLRKFQLQQTELKMRFMRTAIDNTIYGEEVYFYITSISDTASFDNINSFTVELQGTGEINQMFCPIPMNVYVDNITNNSATVHWDDYPMAVSYGVLVNGNSQTGGGSPRVLIGLDSNTEYTISVRTQCGGSLGSSEPSEEVVFTTL